MGQAVAVDGLDPGRVVAVMVVVEGDLHDTCFPHAAHAEVRSTAATP